MRRYAFAAVLGIAGVAVLLSLGVWQMQRMAWKAGILAQIEAMIVAAPVPLMAAPDPLADKYRPVFASGAFTGDYVEVLAGQKGGSPGVRIIEVFETTQGQRILIDRGFLAEEDRRTPRPARPARVLGNLHWPVDANEHTPPPDARTGLWFARDVPKIAEALGSEPVLIVASAPTGDEITPVPLDSSGIANDHFGYALTWFALAVVWAAMTGYLGVRIRRQTV